MQCPSCGVEIKEKLQEIFDSIDHSADIRLFELGWQVCFPVYGSDGAPTPSQVAYLRNATRIYAFWVHSNDRWGSANKAIQEFAGKSKPWDSGNMGLPETV